MGVSGHCRTSQAGTLASSTETAGAAFPCSQTFTRHPRLTMRTPTTSQLRTAIEVLKNLEERVDNHATNVVIQLPDTRCGDDYAARIESQTRSEEHTSELHHTVISYAVFCLKKKKKHKTYNV